MSILSEMVGARLRLLRNQRGYSQETLAERAGLHPTYIGQVERGEKNVTVDSLAKITAALDVPITAAFGELDTQAEEDSYPLKAYRLLSGLKAEEQEKVYCLLEGIVNLNG